MEETDPLFDIKTNYYIGNYQGAINEARSGVSARNVAKEKKQIWIYRAELGLGEINLVLEEIPRGESDVSLELQALRIYAEYLYQKESSSKAAEDGLVHLQNILRHGPGDSDLVLLLCAQLAFSMGKFDDSLRCTLQAHQSNLESHALAIQNYLALHRPDLADKEWLAMKALEEDAPLSQLARAWISAYVGGDRLREAKTIFEELIDAHQATPLLLNSLAGCFMRAEQFPSAEKLLLRALEINNKDPDTLVNLIVCSHHLPDSSDSSKRYLRTLRSCATLHPWILSVSQQEATFDSLADSYLSSLGRV